MKTMNKIAAMSAIVAGLASCSQESEVNICDCGHDDGTSACYLSVASVDKEGYSMTRATDNKEAFEVGDAIGVWVDDGTSSETYNGKDYSNICVTKEESGWTMGKGVALTNTSAKVYALYPYDKSMTGTDVAISLNNTTDYLYDVVTGKSKSSPSASFTMKHIRSILVVNISRGDFTGDGEITSCKISATSLKTTGTYNVKTNKFTADTEADHSISMSGTVEDSKTLTNQWYVFSAYGSATSKISFAFTIDGVKYDTKESSTAIRFEPGYIYTYNITLNNTGMDVSSVDITPWAEKLTEDVPVTY